MGRPATEVAKTVLLCYCPRALDQVQHGKCRPEWNGLSPPKPLLPTAESKRKTRYKESRVRHRHRVAVLPLICLGAKPRQLLEQHHDTGNRQLVGIRHGHLHTYGVVAYSI